MDGTTDQFRVPQPERHSAGQQQFTVVATKPDGRLVLGARQAAIRIDRLTVRRLDE